MIERPLSMMLRGCFSSYQSTSKKSFALLKDIFAQIRLRLSENSLRFLLAYGIIIAYS